MTRTTFIRLDAHSVFVIFDTKIELLFCWFMGYLGVRDEKKKNGFYWLIRLSQGCRREDTVLFSSSRSTLRIQARIWSGIDTQNLYNTPDQD